MVSTTKYIRKPLYVDAVQVTVENFAQIAAWCQGEVRNSKDNEVAVGAVNPDKQYIRVRVHNPKNTRQTKAFVGDWLLYTERGYKVYTDKAFEASFDQVAKKEPKTLIGTAEPIEAGERVKLVEAKTHDIPTQPLHAVPEPKQSIQEAADELHAVEEMEPGVSEPDKIVPDAAEGKQVLSIEEQKGMTAEELRSRIQAGEVVLAQDIARP